MDTPSLGDGAVTTAKLDTDAVGTANIQDDAVSDAKLATPPASTATANTLVRRDGNADFSARTVSLAGNLELANTTPTAGNILKDGLRFLHNPGDGNTFLGENAGTLDISGDRNTAIGREAGERLTTGWDNSLLGAGAGSMLTTGRNNVAVGVEALGRSSGGGGNVAVGQLALLRLATGNVNTALGLTAGTNLETGDHNVYISNDGEFSESGTMRFGRSAFQTRAFIAGIHGVTVPNETAVFINSTGQLGTVSSSARYKEQIEDMADASALLMRLRPVTFRYRPEHGGGARLQYGLIAEEVAEVAPELAVYDEAGASQTVRYHLLAPMLLNEVQKQARALARLEAENQDLRFVLTALRARLDALEAAAAASAAPTSRGYDPSGGGDRR